ncbi:hypothetical protein F5Y14DRAFT_445130 [Nemania sp. NC0429]|nr:hypothetical protein F5Y14DRAFT_445130 [Nemania sp. NC0429]
MSSPNRIDGGLLAPLSVPKAPARTPQSANQPTIMIEPTPESQQFYNQNRREMDRQRFELHVTEESNLELPQAEPMSRSTTSDSLPSPATVYSQFGDGNSVLSPDPTTETVRSRPHRGRRKGPLDLETRTKTAFKRKFKLTCAFHRAKRTSCNCHDFSKLEEGYRRYLATEAEKAKASQGPLVRAFGEIGTFGIGGASDGAPTTLPRYQNVDLPELSPGPDPLPQMHSNLLPVLRFDIDSAASVNAIVSVPREEPFFLAPLPLINDSPVPIGCSMLRFRNRWECRYQRATEETRSLASNTTDSCSWTGPFDQLSTHFSNEHHPFQPADIAYCSICLQCSAMSPEWVEERACPEPDKCHPDSWQRWFFGTPPRLNPNRRRLTVSGASGSQYSWIDPSWNTTTPGSSNTEPSNRPYASYTDKSAFHEHSANGNERHEAGDSERRNTACYTYEGLQGRYPYQSNPSDPFRYGCIGNWLPSPRCKMRPGSVICNNHLSLACPSRSYLRLVLPLLALLVVFCAQAERDLINMGVTLLALLAGSYCLAIVGLLVAWAVVCSLRIRISREMWEGIVRRISASDSSSPWGIYF